MAPKRLTRVEAQAQTRARLLQAAARVFTQKGSEGASVEEVAAEAGFSKGAVYANFASKEALFQAVCDEYMENQKKALYEIFEREKSAIGRVEAAGQYYSDLVKKYREWELLSQEYWLYTQRHPEVNKQFKQERREEEQSYIVNLLEQLYEEQSVSPPLPLGQLASLCIALVKGLAHLQISDPEAIPDSLYGDAFRLILGFHKPATAQEDKPS